MKKLRFNDITVTISDDFINNVLKYKQTDHSTESGGIILGKVSKNLKCYYFTDMSIPCKEDKSSRLTFIRNRKNAQKVINSYHKNSQGIINYLGEWHTHPFSPASPSYEDIRSMKKTYKMSKLICDVLFMIILGSKGDLFVSFIDKELNLNQMEEYDYEEVHSK